MHVCETVLQAGQLLQISAEAGLASSRLPPAFSMPARATSENASAENFKGFVSWPLPKIYSHTLLVGERSC